MIAALIDDSGLGRQTIPGVPHLRPARERVASTLATTQDPILRYAQLSDSIPVRLADVGKTSPVAQAPGVDSSCS